MPVKPMHARTLAELTGDRDAVLSRVLHGPAIHLRADTIDRADAALVRRWGGSAWFWTLLALLVLVAALV